ncbi:AMP binding enzyme [Schizosaccharomyces octosporus yFS286]|uniref:AMP binding enzyme n=1 Tax=Schizosaccharomyces octosporus (strain yFS286) TaxID=483514 RepID=S9PZE2_SCHOY|nr:AMP binding enzyme [Schizosaccharomyces octosporus yFS286]EPX74436.1 AMP binding enzyme [Schizosaccharomyces octosporus yFS286]
MSFKNMFAFHKKTPLYAIEDAFVEEEEKDEEKPFELSKLLQPSSNTVSQKLNENITIQFTKKLENIKIHPALGSKYQDVMNQFNKNQMNLILKIDEEEIRCKKFALTKKISRKLVKDIFSTKQNPHLQYTVQRKAKFEINDPKNPSFSMLNFQTILDVLSYRSHINPKAIAHIFLGKKGREISQFSWEKFFNKVTRVAKVVKKQVGLLPGTKVILYYRKLELAEYLISLFGCLLLGLIVLPVHPSLSLHQLACVVKNEKVKVAFTTESTFRIFVKDSELGSKDEIEWWKSTDFIHYKVEVNSQLTFQPSPHDVALIDYIFESPSHPTKAVYKHHTIMNQVKCLTSSIITHPSSRRKCVSVDVQSTGDNFITNFQPHNMLGLIMGVFNAMFSGYQTIFCETEVLKTPGLLVYILSKYRVSHALFDYASLKQTIYNYQEDPMSTLHYKKNYIPDLSNLKICMVECTVVDPEFKMIASDRWLYPLGNTNSKEVITPLLCLQKFGGIPVSFKDWMINSNEQHMGRTEDDECHQEILVLRESIEKGLVDIIPFLEIGKYSANDILCLSPFWYPIPESSVAIVSNPTQEICEEGKIGNLWVYSNCLPIYLEEGSTLYASHKVSTDSSQASDVFLDSGLKGFLYNKKIFILGYENEQLQLSKQVLEGGLVTIESRTYHSFYLMKTLINLTPWIFDGVVIDIKINDYAHPVIILESPLLKPSYVHLVNTIEDDGSLTDSLNKIAENTYNCMKSVFGIDVLCVLITPSKSLPRTRFSESQTISPENCRVSFLSGTLPVSYYKFYLETIPDFSPSTLISKSIWSKELEIERLGLLGDQNKQFITCSKPNYVLSRATDHLLNYFTILDFFKNRAWKSPGGISFSLCEPVLKQTINISWSAFENKVASLVEHMQTNVKIRQNQYALLLYNDPYEFVVSLYGCFFLGICAIPLQIHAVNHVVKEIEEIMRLCDQFPVNFILLDDSTFINIKSRDSFHHLQQVCNEKRVKVPKMYNTNYLPTAKRPLKKLISKKSKEHYNKDKVALVTVSRLTDGSTFSVNFSHSDLLHYCREQKEFILGDNDSSLLGGIEFGSGIGLLHTAFLGIYTGLPTVLVRRSGDRCQKEITLQTMLGKRIPKVVLPMNYLLNTLEKTEICEYEGLNEMVKCIIVPCYEKIETSKVRAIIDNMFRLNLKTEMIKLAYCHPLNPLICWSDELGINDMKSDFDTNDLKKGLITLKGDNFNKANTIYGLGTNCLQNDICVVHPESKRICNEGEVGEIWIAARRGSYCTFDHRNVGSELLTEENLKKQYFRTGYLGFIHPKSLGSESSEKFSKILYILGAIWNTFEKNGLNHFASDIEETVEQVHPNICKEGCLIFNAADQLTLLVEVHNMQKLTSLVPTIVSTVLVTHKVIVDNVVFVPQGILLRWATGEKRRSEMLKKWITGRINIAKVFSISQETSSNHSQRSDDFYVNSESTAGEFNFYRFDNSPILLSRKSEANHFIAS